MKLSLLLLAAAALFLPAHAVASSPGGGESSRLVPALPLGTGTVDQIESLMATPPFDQGVWGLEVRDMATGKKLLGINTHRQFQAASTTKNFTTAAALDALGKNHRFRTPVTHTGRILPTGVARGDLILEASGDLTLGGREKPDGSVDFEGFDHTARLRHPDPPAPTLASTTWPARSSARESIGFAATSSSMTASGSSGSSTTR